MSLESSLVEIHTHLVVIQIHVVQEQEQVHACNRPIIIYNLIATDCSLCTVVDLIGVIPGIGAGQVHDVPWNYSVGESQFSLSSGINYGCQQYAI